MKDFIFTKLNIDIVIYLIDNLGEKEQNDFLEEIMNICKFTKDEYFSNNENTKIVLLYDLYEKGKLKKYDEENYLIDIEPLLSEIIDDMEGEIGIKKIEEFLKNEEIAIKKLSFIKIILKYFNPEEYYKDLKKLIEEINININDLTYISNLIKIFHREKYRKEMKELVEIIKDLQEKSIKNYKTQKMQESIKTLKELKITADQINKFKDFLFFKVLYDEDYSNDQEKRFNQAIKKLENIKSEFNYNQSANEIYQCNKDIFNKIKEIISNDEFKSNEFIERMIDYFEIKDKNGMIKELTLIFKSKKYEKDLKSIIYFFDNLKKDNSKDEWNKKLSSKYKKLSEMNLEDLKKNLKELKENGIYDFENNNNYCKLFTCLYDKKEAIDFLSTKTNQDINVLYDKIDPTNPSITMKNIQDTEECIKIFNEFKKLNDNFKIFNYIKNLDNNKISKFEIFSKNYTLIIELDRNDDSSLNLYQLVMNIIQDANFIFRQDSEDFYYDEKSEINIEELIHLKNKIHIKPSKETEEPNDEYQKKCFKLNFFKNIISNLEVIYEYIKELRIKGSNLPILISIQIKFPNKEYFLNNKSTEFEKIRQFLFLAKTDYISQLDSAYKNKQHLRFLFGNLFNNIIKHLDKGYNVLDILRFILNKTDNKEEIKDGNATNPLEDKDYVQQYKIYNEKSFDYISNYVTSLFENNSTTLQKHYEEMLIKDKYYNKYKGIYLYICENESMEEFILNIYMEKIGKLPIAQNVLIISNETSQEEMQSFLSRAILCDYNTLFIVEIKDSISEFQNSIMNTYIDKFLTYKKELYNKKKC